MSRRTPVPPDLPLFRNCSKACHSCGCTPRVPHHWLRFHERLSAEAEAWSGKVVLVGDSMIEHLRGTSDAGTSFSQLRQVGWASFLDTLDGSNRTLRHAITDRWGAPLLLGIAGDQTQHLLWRLEHGELPRELRARADVLYVLQIGTNNMGVGSPRPVGLGGMSPGETADGVLAVANWLLNQTSGHVAVTALLPRGHLGAGWRNVAAGLIHDTGGPYTRTNVSVPCAVARAAIPAANHRVRLGVARMNSSRASFVSCGENFGLDLAGDCAVNRTMLSDELHPSAAGYAHLLPCWMHKAAHPARSASPGGPHAFALSVRE